MSRYVDADAYAAEMKTRQDACLELMNAAREMDNEEMYGQKSAAFSVFVEAKLTLDAMPTVDAVPVVRCEDCLHHTDVYPYDEEYELNPSNAVFCQHFEVIRDKNWFCADGERTHG